MKELLALLGMILAIGIVVIAGALRLRLQARRELHRMMMNYDWNIKRQEDDLDALRARDETAADDKTTQA